jgi:hypothetical protein
MFCSPCAISIHTRKRNQPDAPFIFSLFSHRTATCFRVASGPSSGGSNVYMWQSVRVVCVSGRLAGHPGLLTVHWQSADSPLTVHWHIKLVSQHTGTLLICELINFSIPFLILLIAYRAVTLQFSHCLLKYNSHYKLSPLNATNVVNKIVKCGLAN